MDRCLLECESLSTLIRASCTCRRVAHRVPIPVNWRDRFRHGDSLDGMPPLELVRGKDGHLRINDGVTRATRAATFKPGVSIPAEVIHNVPNLDVTRTAKVKDVLS